MRSCIIKLILGYKNKNQNHGHVRLDILSKSMSIIGSNFSCKENAQKQPSKTLGSGMAL